MHAEVRRERLAAHAGSGYAVMTVRGLPPTVWVVEASRVLQPAGIVLWWTSKAKAEQLGGVVPDGHVLQCPLPSPAIGTIAIWRRCST